MDKYANEAQRPNNVGINVGIEERIERLQGEVNHLRSQLEKLMIHRHDGVDVVVPIHW